MQNENKAAKAAIIFGLLVQTYGEPHNTNPSDPTAELVLTILSQNTNDQNRDRAFANLKQRFPTWAAVVAANPEDIAEAIRPGGLGQIKAPRIQAVLQAVKTRFGSYDLTALCSWSLDQAMVWLTSMPGVGPKTAACVMLFSCGKPVMPVDTHVMRVTSRLGLIENRSDTAKAQTQLSALLPPERLYPMHINLIRHGRRLCRPTNPGCLSCSLTAYCNYWAAKQ